LCAAIYKIITTNGEAYGIYHASSEGITNWYEFAIGIRDEAVAAGLIDTNPEIWPIPTEEYPVKAVRPKWSALSKEKLVRVFGFRMPLWREGLHSYIREVMR
jgi:dTDP-4-dehydrorhamnose reductase